MITLMSYLIFVLSGLSSGLQNLNSSAVDSWDAKSIILNPINEPRLNQSFLQPNKYKDILANKDSASLTLVNTILSKNNAPKLEVQIIGINKKIPSIRAYQLHQEINLLNKMK